MKTHYDKPWSDKVFEVVKRESLTNQDLDLFYSLFYKMVSKELRRQAKFYSHYVNDEITRHDEISFTNAWFVHLRCEVKYFIEGTYKHSNTDFIRGIRVYLRNAGFKLVVEKKIDEYGNITNKHPFSKVNKLVLKIEDKSKDYGLFSLNDLSSDIISEIRLLINTEMDKRGIKDPDKKEFIRSILLRKKKLEDIEDRELRKIYKDSLKKIRKEIAKNCVFIVRKYHPNSKARAIDFEMYMGRLRRPPTPKEDK